MQEAIPVSAFKFEHFKVVQFSYKESETAGLKLLFDPSGSYDPQKGIFELKIKFQAIAEENNEVVVEMYSVSRFLFKDAPSFEGLPEFFYTNSIAIVFPYIRAFISTLTLQTGSKFVMLGLMNLTSLTNPLKKNTVVIGAIKKKKRP